MSTFDTDDESDFGFGQSTTSTGVSAQSGNRLASLFKTDSIRQQSNNDTLVYKAPKQPRDYEQPAHQQQQQQSNNKISILFLSTVQVFKYINSNYENQGKTACTLIGNCVGNQLAYNLILYVEKTQPIVNIKIHDNFKLVIQSNNYVSFYDDRSQPWSIMFETDKLLIDFATKITLCKCNLQSTDYTLVQDLRVSSNESNAAQTMLESNDQIEVSTLVTLCKDRELNDVIENTQAKPFKVKLDKGKLPKLVENSILNMKLGGRRLIVARASRFVPFYQELAQSSVLFYDISVLRIKKASMAKETQEEEKRILESQYEDTRSRSSSIKDKSKVLNEQIAEVKTEKSKLISRMAKMGQQMLPLSGATVAANIESDEETQQVYHQRQQPMQTPHQNQPASYGYTQDHQHLYQMQQQQSNQLTLFRAPTQPLNQAPIVTYIQTPSQQQQQLQPQVATNISEEAQTRNQQQQQTLILKLDTINERLEQIKSMQQILNSQANVNYPNLETGVLLYNLTKIIKENEQYKKDLYEKSQKVDELNNKITELLARNQNFVEKSHALLEYKNDSFQSSAEKIALRVLELEQDKMRLTSELSKTTAMISDLNLEMNRVQLSENELKLKLSEISKNTDTHKQEVNRLRIENADLQAKYDQSSDEIKTLKSIRKQLELKSSTKDDELAELKTNLFMNEKALVERKEKSESEKQQLLSEIDELKAQNQAEIKELKEKIAKFKQNSSHYAGEQIKQLEFDLNKEWEAKSEKLLKTQEAKLRREIEQLHEEKCEQEKRVDEVVTQVKTLRLTNNRLQVENENTKQIVEEMSVFREKYERLQSQALVMKERYEARIKELIEAEPDAEVIAEEVKRTMNGIYRKLKSQIKPHEYYAGNGILSAMLKIIKMITMQMLHNNDQEEEEDIDIDYFSQHILDTNEQLKILSVVKAEKEQEKLRAIESRVEINEMSETIEPLITQRKVEFVEEATPSVINVERAQIIQEKEEKANETLEFEIVNASNEDDNFSDEEGDKLKATNEDEQTEIKSNEEMVQSIETNKVIFEEKAQDNFVTENILQNEETAFEEEKDDNSERNKPLTDQHEVLLDSGDLQFKCEESNDSNKNRFDENDKLSNEKASSLEQEPTKKGLFDDDEDELFKDTTQKSEDSLKQVEVVREKEAKKSSLFGDDDGGDDLLTFITSKPRANSAKSDGTYRPKAISSSLAAAATTFEPPPLFDDDGDDNSNTRDDIDWFK